MLVHSIGRISKLRTPVDSLVALIDYDIIAIRAPSSCQRQEQSTFEIGICKLFCICKITRWSTFNRGCVKITVYLCVFVINIFTVFDRCFAVILMGQLVNLGLVGQAIFSFRCPEGNITGYFLGFTIFGINSIFRTILLTGKAGISFKFSQVFRI